MRHSGLLIAALALGAACILPAAASAQGARAEHDSLQTRPRLGGGSYWEREAPAGEAGDAAAPAAGETAWRPPLDVEQLRLQEVLAQNLLPDEENARRVQLFAVDSLLAVDLYQLRGAEAPHVYPQSDLWIYIWRGRGRFLRERATAGYGPGELLQVPAGTAFALENESGAPTVALLWQWPPIDELLTRSLPPTAEDAVPLWEALRLAPAGEPGASPRY